MRITINPEQLASIASVGIAAARPKEPTPVIQAVQLSGKNGEIHAMATDRYRAARVILPVEGVEDFEGVAIPAVFLAGFAKAVKALKTYAEVTIEFNGETVTASTPGITQTTAPTPGNFPPLARLFPETFSEGVPVVSLNMKRVADAAKLSHPAANRLDAMRFRFTETSNPAKPGPILIDYALKDGEGRCEYLLQPNLILR